MPGKPVVGTFYRITRGEEVTEEDFYSNAQLGKRPREAELMHPEEHRAVSVYSSPRDARDHVAKFPRSGSHIATLVIPRGAPITGRHKPEFFRSHWNLWGEPRTLLRYVRGRAVLPENLDIADHAG